MLRSVPKVSVPDSALRPVDMHLAGGGGASPPHVPHKHLAASHVRGSHMPEEVDWKPQSAAKLRMSEGKIDPNSPSGEFDPNALWFDRVVTFPEKRIIVCGIEKNGVTELNQLAAAIHNDTMESWFKYSPQSNGIKFTTFLRLLKFKSWRKALIYRDPMERFLSAYNSKCLKRDIDGYLHCHRFFNLTDDEVSLRAVAERLPRDGHLNPHWARQGAFCGNTFASNWGDYDFHIPTRNLSRLMDVFDGRLDADEEERAQAFVRSSAPNRALSNHTTNAEASIHEESLAVRRLLYDYYAEDYRLFQTNFVYVLGEEDVEQQQRDWQGAVVAEQLRMKERQKEKARQKEKEDKLQQAKNGRMEANDRLQSERHARHDRVPETEPPAAAGWGESDVLDRVPSSSGEASAASSASSVAGWDESGILQREGP